MKSTEGSKKTAAKTAVRSTIPHRVPQTPGGALLSGGVPGNAGGRAGRSGRKPDAFRERLERLRDEKGLKAVEAILDGRSAHMMCGHCGVESCDALGELVPTVEARLRAAELTMRYTVGLTKTIKLDGVRGVAEAFEMIRSRIRASLAPEAAERLISDISADLQTIR
jgi:hypothetical protein